MGTFTVGCKIANHQDRSRAKVIPRVMVDSGSEYTWIAGSALREIGIVPEKKIHAVMANGSVLEREAGFALVMVGKFVTTDEVVFAQKGDLLLLGARTLEGLNVKVDPQAKRLVEAGPTPAAPLADFTEEEARAHWEGFRGAALAPLAAPRAEEDKPSARRRTPAKANPRGAAS